MNKTPHFSIIVPIYSRYTLEECLKSIKRSLFTDYEIIVVGGNDAAAVAKDYTDKIVPFVSFRQRGLQRDEGIRTSSGEIIVFVDADIMLKPETLTKIADFFNKHEEVDAITGLLSKEHPNKDFFSQYKNLYMHYIFKRLPDKVTFLFGSICAIRRRVSDMCISGVTHKEAEAHDTDMGQNLFLQGRHVEFLRDLEVIHLKKYTFLSFLKNDFEIPFFWTRIFLSHRGWRQLGKHKTGFAHSPKEQLLSVMLAPAIIFLTLIYGFVVGAWLGMVWLMLNVRFFVFLARERGFLFGIIAIFVTFADNIVMASGIACGLILALAQKIKGILWATR